MAFRRLVARRDAVSDRSITSFHPHVAHRGSLEHIAALRSSAVETLITHRFPIDDAAEASRIFDERLTEKVVLVWE